MKKFFQNVLNAVAQWRSNILRNLPLRMTVGRFGIWLMSIGRFLQVRYANWNSEFRLKVEFCPNPDYGIIHVSEMVTDQRILTFEGPKCQYQKRTPMVDELFAIKGIDKVTLQTYQISILKARVYRWEELLPSIEKIVLKYLTA